MDSEDNFYDILGVNPSAPLGDIKKAFRRLVKVHHPDKCGNADVADTNVQYLRIQQAFETLSDSQARQDYDNWLKFRKGDKEDERTGSERKNHGLTAGEAAERCFAINFYSGENIKRADGQEPDDCSHSYGSGKTLGGEPQSLETSGNATTELFQRINVGSKPLSHEDGFRQWLRSRPSTSCTIVNDEIILRTQGAAGLFRDEEISHQYTWPVTAFVSKASQRTGRRKARIDDVPAKEYKFKEQPENGSLPALPRAKQTAFLSDEVDENEDNASAERVEKRKVTLKEKLQWGDVLVRILHAAVLPYDRVLLREGLDVLAAAADSAAENDETCSFLRTTSTTFVTPVSSSEHRVEDDYFLGTSCVAQVVELGKGVKELQRGDIVLPLGASDGCWRGAAVWQEKRLMALPKDLFPKLEHAAVAKQLFLAYHLLQQYAQDLQPGDAVLIYGSGCLVGQLVVQLCRLLRLRSFFIWRHQCQRQTTVRAVKDYFKSLGASNVFDEEENVAAQLTKARQSFPLLAIELTHGQKFCGTLPWLARGGKVVLAYEAEACHFRTALVAPSVPKLLSRGIKVESFYLNGWLQSRKNQQRMCNALECIGTLLRAGKLIVNLTEVDELSETAVKAALVSVRQPWSGSTPHQQPLLTFASLEVEKVAFEENQKADAAREQEARQLQQELFSRRDHLFTTRSTGAEDKSRTCFETLSQEAGLSLELPATEYQSDSNTVACFFVHGRGEIPEELLITLKRYKHNLRETFHNAKFIFPAAPYECKEDGADVPSWAGQHVQSLLAPVDGKKSFERRVAGNCEDTRICPEEIEALKDLEASCDCLADLIEEKVGVSGNKARSVVLCGAGEGALVALLTALTKLQLRIEAVLCIGMPLLHAHILSFLLSKATIHAQKALRRIFSEAGYCTTKEVILEGTHETDERTLAHVAAVFSILKLS